MSAFGQGSVANYSTAPLMEGYAKKTVSIMNSNANILIDSRDRNKGIYNAPVTQPYNNFAIAKGFPLSQGAITNIKVTEVRFPWTIPNITPYNNTFKAEINNGVTDVSGVIVIDPGFYTGAELAFALNTALVGSALGNNSPFFTYIADGSFIIQGRNSYKFKLYPPAGSNYINQGLLTTLGYDYSLVPVGGTSIFNTNPTSLLYTAYVDITSDVLTQFQDLTDTSTAEVNNRHQICRLYCANETSTVSADISGNPIFPGSTPFIIHRQFKNPKVMKWNNQNSVDRIDIQLRDDQGRLLYLPNPYFSYGEFQITLQCSEM